MSTKSILVVFVWIVGLTHLACAQTASNKNDFNEVKKNSQQFLLNGKPVAIPAAPSRKLVEGEQIPKQDYIRWGFIECRVAWNEECDGTDTIVAPDGWMVCAPIYHVTEDNGRRGLDVTPGTFMPNDVESPPRFRSVNFRVWAKGSGSIFDRYGSVIRIEHVGISIVPIATNNQERFGLGCWMPSP
jgi:hypothetical protein